MVEKKVSAVEEPEKGEQCICGNNGAGCRDASTREGRQRGMGHHRRQRKSLGASSPDLISARTSCAHLKGCFERDS